VRERIIAGKGGMTFSIMPLAVGVQIAGYCHYWLLLALRFAECTGRRRAMAVGRLSPAFFVTLRRVHIYEDSMTPIERMLNLSAKTRFLA
jgi:hypothetical protein